MRQRAQRATDASFRSSGLPYRGVACLLGTIFPILPPFSSRTGACHAEAGFAWGWHRCPGRLIRPIAPHWVPLVVAGSAARCQWAAIAAMTSLRRRHAGLCAGSSQWDPIPMSRSFHLDWSIQPLTPCRAGFTRLSTACAQPESGTLSLG